MDHTVHGILQARILWVAFLFSRGSSQPKDWTQVSHIAAECLPGKPSFEARFGYVTLLAHELWVPVNLTLLGEICWVAFLLLRLWWDLTLRWDLHCPESQKGCNQYRNSADPWWTHSRSKTQTRVILHRSDWGALLITAIQRSSWEMHAGDVLL